MKRLLAACAAVLLATGVASAALDAKPAAPLHISQGKRVDLARYLVPGKSIVFDFTSRFCPPCRAYDHPLELLHAQRDDVVVIKVDINRPDTRGIDWQSPVARQFGLQSIPAFKVYSPEGKLVAEDRIEFDAGGNPRRQSAARAIVDGWISQLK